MLCQPIDTMVLGCTHYPLLKPLLQDVAGPHVHLVDSAEAMADQTAEVLQSSGLAATEERPPEYVYDVTDVPFRFQTIGERFLGRTLSSVRVVKW
nr:hypothetical protein [Desulfosoma caldarium]